EEMQDDLLDRGILGIARASRAVSGTLVGNLSALENLPGIRCTFGDGAECCTRGACAPQNSPLASMTLPERVRADYETMNLTIGPHPMKLLRQSLPNVWRAIDLRRAWHGATVQIAGNVICRQRPGTAKGFVF